MKRPKLHLSSHILLALLLFITGYTDILYRLLFVQYYNVYLSCGIVALTLIMLASFYHIWYLKPYKRLLNTVNIYYSEILSQTAVNMDESQRNEKPMFKSVPYDALERMLKHYMQHEHEQALLVNKLRSDNSQLDKNSRFANAIVEITSTILRSGDIHSILQLILDKAIEIIPNAQKGSILLYNGEYLEYKAMRGYDIKALKDFRFEYSEIFQYGAKDLYAPIIIRDVERFNRKLKKDKFTTLKETRSFELKACLSCAISLDNKFYGIINIDNINDSYAFSEIDKPIIKYFAEQIGVALKNAQLLEKTLYLSRYDSLTGICNRSYFEEQLQSIYMDAKENSKRFGLVCMDLNYLKSINDSYGHEAGDKLIVAFTEYISGMVDGPDAFGRIGGDEFAMVYIDKTREELAKRISRIISHFKEVPFVFNNEALLNITFGFGISCYPEDAPDTAALLRIADKLMYKEKRRYKEELRRLD